MGTNIIKKKTHIHFPKLQWSDSENLNILFEFKNRKEENILTTGQKHGALIRKLK